LRGPVGRKQQAAFEACLSFLSPRAGFVVVGWLIDDPKMHPSGIIADLSLSVVLAVLPIIVSGILLFG
jgi:hypothetical protein